MSKAISCFLKVMNAPSSTLNYAIGYSLSQKEAEQSCIMTLEWSKASVLMIGVGFSSTK